MAEHYGKKVVEDGEELATDIEPIMQCCLCGSWLRNPVQLTCLHNCCQRCFTEAASTSPSRDVVCGTCSEITRSSTEQPNRFVDREVRRHRASAGWRMCDICLEDYEVDKQAVEWCPECRYSLCKDCLSAHRNLYADHHTQLIENFSASAEVLHSTGTSCPHHDKLLEFACLTCEKEKCTTCCADCIQKKHEIHAFNDDLFNDYVRKIADVMSSMQYELLHKSKVLSKSRSVMMDLKAARNEHLQQINQRKRLVIDAVEKVYERIEGMIKDTYDELEQETVYATAVADRLHSNLSDAQSYIRRLVESESKCEIFCQQNVVKERLRVLSYKLDSLSNQLYPTMQPLNIDFTLPENLENIIKKWIGTPLVHSAFSFGAASASVELPSECYDVALTSDGSLLLAAGPRGLIEFGSEKESWASRWRPPQNQSDRERDRVHAVAALSNSRAAVGLCYAKLIVLLRRGVKCGSNAANALPVWTEYGRLDPLPWSPLHLSAHGDVLVVSECGRKLQLMCASSRRRLNGELRREYHLRSLAITADAIVTGSDLMKLSNGRSVYVLDAHRITGGYERLWRQDLSSDENMLLGLCADSEGGCLYVALCRSDTTGCRVSALSLTDGSELRRVALSFESVAPQAPLLLQRLSLCEVRASEQQQQQSLSTCSISSSRSRRVLLLATLCFNRDTGCQTVTMHRSSSELQ